MSEIKPQPDHSRFADIFGSYDDEGNHPIERTEAQQKEDALIEAAVANQESAKQTEITEITNRPVSEVTTEQWNRLVELGAATSNTDDSDGEFITTYSLKEGYQFKSKQHQVGDTIEVKTRTTYQHLSGGAVITPMTEHESAGYQTTIRNIFQEKMEDEHGNEVTEIIIETATGELISPNDIL